MDSTAWIATAMIAIAVVGSAAAIYVWVDIERITRHERGRR